MLYLFSEIFIIVSSLSQLTLAFSCLTSHLRRAIDLPESDFSGVKCLSLRYALVLTDLLANASSS